MKNSTNILKQLTKTLFLCTAIASIHFAFVDVTFARWAKPSDADTANTLISHIDVKSNGASLEKREITIKMLKEKVKPQLAQYALQYNADVSRITIIEAKTIVNGKEYPVDINKIIDKPISSRSKAFDQINQIMIPFPHLEVDATIYLKYEKITTKSIPANAYLNVFAFENNYYLVPNRITIHSELPLYVQTNDPEHLFSVTKTPKKENNTLISIVKIEQLKPFIKKIINEESAQHNLNLKHVPIISVSSLKHFNDYSQAMARDYDAIKQQPLPDLYKEIAKAAKNGKTPTDKINIITALLSQKINYLSNIQTIKGGLVPQSLQTVADSRLGDCKDFSMATATILDSLGFKTKIALVLRGEEKIPMPTHLPGPSHFNHAILKVELPQRALWIDPTNFVSMANHIFPDIANKKALVLDSKQASYETIPNVKAQDNRVIRHETWDMKNPHELKVKGTLKFLGNASRVLTGQRNNASEQTLQHSLIDSLSEPYGKVLNYTMTLPDLHSRIVHDLIFDYTVTTQPSGLQTNAGIAQPLNFKSVNHFIQKKDTVSDIYLGAPRILETVYTIKNIAAIGNQSLDCQIVSPWVNITRTVKYKKDHILVHQIMETKKSWLTGTELESKAYQQLQLDITQHFNNGIAIIFDPKPAGEPSRASS